MRLLIITQKVDKNDPVLGFFHRWIEEFAKWCEFVIVICLEKGEYSLPRNIEVLSLGKESATQNTMIYHSVVQRLFYIIHFYKYIWAERKNYDAVFVHMNQEYVLLGWKFWKLWGKKIYLWRNHARGSVLTRLAVFFSNKVFYTSPSSYTANFNKAVQMPVGIDTDFFKPDLSVARIPNSVLFLGRIAPVKKVLEFVEWFNKLDRKFHATVVGESLPKDKQYEKLVKSRAFDRIEFIGAVTQEEAPKLYQSHELYANLTLTGSMDKTILEAAACETPVKVENADLEILEGKKGQELRDFVIGKHSLKTLMDRLKKEL